MTAAAPLAVGTAPGKFILCGEHAVVYGRPAIAAPLFQVQARAAVYPDRECVVAAVDIQRRLRVAAAPDDEPLATIVRLVCAELGQPPPPWRIDVSSEIPIASGLGSGAAVATATARGLLAAFGVELPAERLSALVYEVEKLHHGTPSGIDNTVVVYGQPVWFVRGAPPQPFAAGAPLHLLVADTGVASPTRLAVGDVRRGWEADPGRYEALFDGVGALVTQARACIESGDAPALGALLNENQSLLAEMGVSSPELDHLVAAARQAGCLGAKLSGGGRGGNMIALVTPDKVEVVRAALQAAGAKKVMRATLGRNTNRPSHREDDAG